MKIRYSYKIDTIVHIICPFLLKGSINEIIFSGGKAKLFPSMEVGVGDTIALCQSDRDEFSGVLTDFEVVHCGENEPLIVKPRPIFVLFNERFLLPLLGK